MNADRERIPAGGISMQKDVEMKRQDPCLRNGLKCQSECQLENRVVVEPHRPGEGIRFHSLAIKGL